MSCLLATYGLRVAAFEQEKEPFATPRAVHLDDEALRIFQFLGLEDAVKACLGRFEAAHFVDERHEPFLFTQVDDRAPYGFRSNHWFHQPSLEAMLQEKARALPQVQLHREHKVEEVRQDAQSVLLKGTTRAGRKFEASGAFLLACDGANSHVRQQLRMALQDLGFEEAWWVVDAYWKGPGDRFDVLPRHHIQYCHPDQPTTYVPGAMGHLRWEFLRLPGQTQTSVPELLAKFVDPATLDLVRIAPYVFHALIADPWQQGRAFLLGDAAHQMPPFAGQGLCSGLRDAMNLAWKLAYVQQGHAPPSLLETYETERSPHVRKICLRAIRLGRIIQSRNRRLARIRNQLLRLAMRTPWLRARMERAFLSKVPLERGMLNGRLGGGELFVQPRVRPVEQDRRQQEVRPLDELLGKHLAVLVLADAAWPGLHEAFPALADLPHKVLRVLQIGDELPWENGLVDVDGTLLDALARHNASGVVLRPDRYVYAYWKE